MIRVVIIAPAMAVRAGLQVMLRAGGADTAPALEVIGEAASLADLDSIPPDTDVLILAEEAGSILLLERALSQFPGSLALLLLTEDREVVEGLSALPLRSWGLLTPDTSAEELQVAVNALHEGLLVGTPALMGPVVSRPLSVESTPSDLTIEQLTDREMEVLQLLAQGLANKQIASSLGISEHTVKFHVSSIYTKLGATNRAEAVRLGVQGGLVVL